MYLNKGSDRLQYRQKYKILTVSHALNQNPLTLSKLVLKIKKSMGKYDTISLYGSRRKM